MRIPVESDFPEGTEFIVREFDVPITYYPPQGWHNWFGGTPSEYDATRLTVTNHDKVLFDEWIKVVEESINTQPSNIYSAPSQLLNPVWWVGGSTEYFQWMNVTELALQVAWHSLNASKLAV